MNKKNQKTKNRSNHKKEKKVLGWRQETDMSSEIKPSPSVSHTTHTRPQACKEYTLRATDLLYMTAHTLTNTHSNIAPCGERTALRGGTRPQNSEALRKPHCRCVWTHRALKNTCRGFRHTNVYSSILMIWNLSKNLSICMHVLHLDKRAVALAFCTMALDVRKVTQPLWSFL